MRGVEALENTMSVLRSQLDHAAHTIVAKDNDLEKFNMEKEKLQQAYNPVKRRMCQIGARVWKKGVSQ